MEQGDEPEMSEEEEDLLLVSLDKGIAQLKDGQGVPIEEVRKMVPKWARGDATPSGFSENENGAVFTAYSYVKEERDLLDWP